MLLRSSSTPILGSLISSIIESPNHHHHHHHQAPEISRQHPTTKHFPPTTTKLSFHQTLSHNFNFSCNSSPISPSVSEFSVGARCLNNGFQRAQSEGHLEGLANASSNVDEFSLQKPMKKFPGRSSGGLLDTIPSFSFHSSTGRSEDDEESEDDEYEQENEEEIRGDLERSSDLNQEKSDYADVYANMGFQKEINDSSHMYLARGLGISEFEGSFGGGDGYMGGNGGCGGGGDDHEQNLEEHYKKLVQENPGDSLFLRNYAQFLYQTKHDLQGAEEYYSRAILIDPEDGEILSQYAKLVWELHHDADRATAYFERAVQAASEDSHVHAAYASFLWEIEDEEEEDLNDSRVLQPLLYMGTMASTNA